MYAGGGRSDSTLSECIGYIVYLSLFLSIATLGKKYSKKYIISCSIKILFKFVINLYTGC